MSFRDFSSRFDRIEMCNLSPDSLSEEKVTTKIISQNSVITMNIFLQLSQGKKKWETSTFEGEWVRGVTAGGCRNYLGKFW